MLLVLGILFSIPLMMMHFFLPSQINLAVGREHFFDIDIPLKATINKDDFIIVKDKEEHIFNHESISLNQPVSVTMLKEGKTQVVLSLLGVLPIKTVCVQALPYEELIPCGQIVGIKIDTDGVLVLGVGEFESDKSMVSPCKDLIEMGDLITACNGKVIKNKEDFRDCIEECGKEPIALSVMHKGTEKQIVLQPCFSSSENQYKIGLWVKDSTQGIGTITFINPRTGRFGALGHGISDSQTHMLTPIKSGQIMEVAITHITKGEKGHPGEVSGIIDYDFDSVLGNVTVNHALGIFGNAEEEFIASQPYEALPIGFRDEVYEGEATILVDLTGEGMQDYQVEIQKVSRFSSEPSKGMVLKITDEKLLGLTNGIIQGMSGSPIIQDGKIIGAITHVFVHDPTRGYGIFIENMLDTAEDVK